MTSRTTQTLLRCGLVAPFLYITVGTLEVLLLPGFDIRRHALSLASNGTYGWIQIANFLLSGALVIAGSLGIRRVLAGSRGGTWGPILLAIYGLGLIGAGIFVADPMDGFPIGTPPGPPVAMSWHGPLHFMTGGIGFFALIACCMVFARRFASQRDTGWALFSVITGLLFLIGFAGIGSGAKAAWINLGFTATVILVWVWIGAVFLKLLVAERPGPQPGKGR